MCIRAILLVPAVVSCILFAASAPTRSSPQPAARTYFIAADEVDWDYAPSNRNGITGALLNIPSGPKVSRIGKVYRKALYREYTDATFTHLKPRPKSDAYLGYLGPVIRAQVGDTVKIVFQNHTRLPLDIVPQPDVGQPGVISATTVPGRTSTYLWHFTDKAAPPQGISSSVWLYYSDVDRVADTSAGLAGPIIVTRRGMAKPNGTPKDVDREVIAMFSIKNEDNSAYLHFNIRRSIGKPATALEADPGFLFSTEMYALNGYAYANLPPVSMRVGERVRWYLISDASDSFDYHSIDWSGVPVLVGGRRMSTVQLEEGQTAVADMQPRVQGTNFISSRTPADIGGVLLAQYRVLPASVAHVLDPSPTVKRTYYIAADEVDWNYAPSGVDRITGKRLHTLSGPKVDRIGDVYRKAIYREYTDATFAHLKPRPPREAYLGFLGPVIRAEVGDRIRVVFKSRTTIPVGFHADGLDEVSRAASAAGTRTYVFRAAEQSGPGPADTSSIIWTYHSDVARAADLSAGLLGPIIVTRRGMAKPDGSPKDADREVIAAFAMVDENTSPYFDYNSRRYTGRPASTQLEIPFTPFYMSNEIATINGLRFGNMPVPVMRQGERVRWYLLADASDGVDYHAVHWHGNTVLDDGMRTDSIAIDPGTSAIADMVPDDPGIWLVHCHMTLHFSGGMIARYRVLPSAERTQTRTQLGLTRTYYIAADEVDWNYAPSGVDRITGKRLHTLSGSKVNRIGEVYRKAIYREYTDATFTHLKRRPPDQAYLGFVGPIIRAEVGDRIKVFFKNNTRFAFGMHPHGVLYDKVDEGALYQDGVAPEKKLGGAVPPGGTFTYVWRVPERAGPGPHDPSSIIWMYHSHVNEVDDLSAGLIGPIVVTRRGMARPDGTPVDVDREVVLLYAMDDENTSRYFDYNSRKYADRPASKQILLPFNPYYGSNEMPSLNGYSFANMPLITIRKGDRVRWYLLADASDYDDAHVAHWRGNAVMHAGAYVSSVALDPAAMEVVDMRPAHLGTWIVECMVPGHFAGDRVPTNFMGGMVARYRVKR